MTSKAVALVRVQLLGMFGINRARHSKDPKERNKLIFLSIGVVLLAALFLAYSTMMAVGLALSGLGEVMPAFMLTISSVITLVTTITKSNGVLFGLKDYDTIMSMPVKTSTVILSRFFFLYTMALLFGCVIMLPFGIVYGLASSATPMVWAMLAVSVFLAPLLPIVVGTALGALITAVSVRFRYKNLVSVVLSLLLVIGIMLGSMSLQVGSEIGLTAIAGELVSMMNRLYPVAILFSAAMKGDLMMFLLFFLLSVGAFVLFLALFSRWYNKINTAVMSHANRSNYRLGELKAASQISALYKKELRRYFSSAIYVVNTFVGMVMLLLFSAALLLTGPSKVEQFAEIPGLTALLSGIAPLIPTVLVAMSSTTCSAISLEGKNRWILYSMPVESIAIFNAKILVNLTILIPPILVSGGLLSAGLKLGVIETLLVLTVPCAYAWFISVTGLAMNLKFPNFDWNSDMEVVKRGAAVLVTMLLGFVSVAVPIAGVILLTGKVDPRVISAAAGVLVALAGWLIHCRLRKVKLYIS